MKKLLVPVILMMALLAGCGNAGNDSLVNKDYTIDSSDNNEPEVTTPVKKEEQQTTSIKKEEQLLPGKIKTTTQMLLKEI